VKLSNLNEKVKISVVEMGAYLRALSIVGLLVIFVSSAAAQSFFQRLFRLPTGHQPGPFYNRNGG
jgi:hypothetical protein